MAYFESGKRAAFFQSVGCGIRELQFVRREPFLCVMSRVYSSICVYLYVALSMPVWLCN